MRSFFAAAIVVILVGGAWEALAGAELTYVGAAGLIAYSRSSGDGTEAIYVVDPVTGAERFLATSPDRDARGPAWSPDGRRLAFVGTERRVSHLYVVNADGSGQKRLAKNSGALAWSPDGSKIAMGADDGGENAAVVIVDSDSGAVSEMNTPIDAAVLDVAWSPLGSKLLLRGDTQSEGSIIVVINVDGSDQQQIFGTGLRPRPHRILSGLSILSPVVWSADGTKIAFAAGVDMRLDIFVMNPDGSDVVNITNTSDRDELSPVWSPDGSTISFVTSGADGLDGEVMRLEVMSPEGAGRRPLVAGLLGPPVWSPDSRRIAFDVELTKRQANGSGETLGYELHVVDVDDGRETTLIARLPFIGGISWQRLPPAVETPTPTFTPTATGTPSPTSTATAAGTPTSMPTPLRTPTPESTATAIGTPTPPPAPTVVRTPTPTSSPTPAPTPP